MNKYFDYAATGLPNTEIINNVLRIYSEEFLFGNPSSNHYIGIESKKLLTKAREKIASILKCLPEEIFFTSGGTESDNLAIEGTMLRFGKQAQMITSEIEHPAVLNTCKKLSKLGYIIHYVKPDENGCIDPNAVEKLINSSTKLISIMSVNNEIGTIEPIKEIARIAHRHDILFHSDMVQGVGLYDIDLKDIDLASFSCHKFGSLKGIGILYKKIDVPLTPILQGGGQENGLRSGTENIFGALVSAFCLENVFKEWNSANKEGIKVALNQVANDLYSEFGSKVYKISNDLGTFNLLNIAFESIDSRTLQLLLSQKGYCISVGSACHSNIDEISHVIKAINVPRKYQNGVVRISATPSTTVQDIYNLGEEIIEILKYLYKEE